MRIQLARYFPVCVLSTALVLLTVSPASQAAAADDAPFIAKPILVGAALGTLGMFVGVGLGASGSDGSFGDGLERALIGGMIGESLGIAAGVHSGNDGRGVFVADLAVSALTLIGGIMIFEQANAPEASAWFIPIAQLAFTTATELTLSQKSPPPSRLQIALGPSAARRIGAVATLRF